SLQSRRLPQPKRGSTILWIKLCQPTPSDGSSRIGKSISATMSRESDGSGPTCSSNGVPGRLRCAMSRHRSPVLRSLGCCQSSAKSPEARAGSSSSGTTGSGKSTTLAALIEFINASFKKHIITLEDPIEFVFEDNQSVIEQREMGLDSLGF